MLRNCSCAFVLRHILENQRGLESTLSKRILENEVSEKAGVVDHPKYRLVGPAYVHGIMDGKIIETIKVQNVDEEVLLV